MITYEQVPMLRIYAKRALEDGKITQHQYDSLKKMMDDIVMEKEKKLDDKILFKMNRQLAMMH